MRLNTLVLAATLAAFPLAVLAQGHATQSRDGLATASQGQGVSNNSLPAGSLNATTGPQSRPAYPSGSTDANPGAAFVNSTTPKPATGAASSPPGVAATVTAGPGGANRVPSPGVGQAATPPK